jgi:glutamate-1-semialdehyde aminotransferase
MAAIVGRKSVMEAVQKTFISSAYFTERVGPAAALASTTKHRKIDAGKTLTEIGTRVQEGWRKAAERTGVPAHVTGIPALAGFGFQDPDAPALMTLFIQEMLGRGFLASDRFYPTVRHEEQHVSAVPRRGRGHVRQGRGRPGEGRRSVAAARACEAHRLRPARLIGD